MTRIAILASLFLPLGRADVNTTVLDAAAVLADAPKNFLASDTSKDIAQDVMNLSALVPKLPAAGDAGSKGFDSTLDSMEAAITDLMMGKGKMSATPMGGSVKQIASIITKTMMPKVLAAHKSDQRNLIRLANEIKKCGSTKNTGLRKSKPASNQYAQMSRLHKRCRSGQAVMYASKNACLDQQRSLYNVQVLRCKYFATVSRNFGTQKANQAIVKKAGSEKTEQYIMRISATICGNHIHGTRGQISKKGGWGGGLPNSMLDKYLKAKEKCMLAKRAYVSKVKECKRKYHAYNVQRAKCNQYQTLMDTNSCKAAVMIKDACEAYAECYYDKKKAYQIFLQKAITEETDRKAEWRGLMRMECLIKAFADGKVSGTEVDACKKKAHSTKHLNLKYPKIPPLQRCALPRFYPTTGAYKRKEFAPLPTMAKGMQSAPCAGVFSMPTTPRKGSPKTCKCRRVTLNGYYSPGGLVKCTKGLDVRRSLDKNSCPRGTKIFSPRSRNDWKTLLASADPLRDPNWIIDVTRPARGCGGCTGNPMNSANRRQKSWTTTDGSAWWLRSTRYTEPNGDYSANCFMDLWRGKPRNENSIAFNDGSCNYHSKSYYCQPISLKLKPKAGSPRSCSCSKVDLTGRYSAGSLVKCEQCISVSRASQKNSCPQGMKIFSPASRQDWKTFISSAGPLRAPHWIIDITRPQNGCGGCKRYAMKSSTPQQATWRTSDGSPWWLRSTVYNEPNGDYRATCYLNINANPTSPDTLHFNDNKCNIHSRSYYCQPTRRNKNYGGHHRRRRAAKPGKKVQAAASCPAGTEQVGGHNRDIKGCGLGGCGGRYGLRNAEQCRDRCNAHKKCKGFTFAPKGGDKAHRRQTVCSLYTKDAPNANRGPNQVFCRPVEFRPKRGVLKDFSLFQLIKAGWKTWSDVSYAHRTKKKDIQPPSGECILWGSKRSAGDTKLALAAIGRRKVILNKKKVKENGVWWYTVYPKSNGFSMDSRLSLNSADVNHIKSDTRLSWHLHKGRGVGGYRSGKTTGLNANRKWRKVVMYGPCNGMKK